MGATMDDKTPRPRWRFTLPWGILDVFADGPVPLALQPTAAVLAHMEDRFRPALLRPHRWPEGAYAAVWPANRPVPEHAETSTEPGLQKLEDVVLAEIHPLACHVCTARFQAVYPAPGIPFFGPHLAAHQLIRGCTVCGSDFATSRLQALALLPAP
ncbi:hypothetical protein GCM10027073_10190 [Streptomyces chlorus]